MLISSPPIYDNPIEEGGSFSQKWQSWINNLHKNVSTNNQSCNPSILLNSDFNWSRTKGNTPTTADGSFVEKWFVKGGGMTFSITPTFYTSTKYNSNTGSERYVNLSISTLNANEFFVYQIMDKYVSLLHNKDISFSCKLLNNNSNKHKLFFYVGFDVDDNGTNEHIAQSKIITIVPGINNINCNVQCPEITTDNQINKTYIGLKMKEISDIVNFDIFFIKSELSSGFTNLYIDHALEKIRIDNT